jgi:hypothetical protein
MSRNYNIIGEGGRKSGGGTSNHSCSWSSCVLNIGLGVRMSGYLRRGMGKNLLIPAFTFDRCNIFLIGWKKELSSSGSSGLTLTQSKRKMGKHEGGKVFFTRSSR